MRDVDWNRMKRLKVGNSLCRPSYEGRGLKSSNTIMKSTLDTVVPLMRDVDWNGKGLSMLLRAFRVVPLMRDVDWNPQSPEKNPPCTRRPSYEGRGLKSTSTFVDYIQYRRPSYEGRGLKSSDGYFNDKFLSCRPSYEGRGLKSPGGGSQVGINSSRPSYEGRGLKFLTF